MRRILIDRVRRRATREKKGLNKLEVVEDSNILIAVPDEELLNPKSNEPLKRFHLLV